MLRALICVRRRGEPCACIKLLIPPQPHDPLYGDSMPFLDRQHEMEALARLRQSGLRATVPRLMIFTTLAQHAEGLTAQGVIQALNAQWSGLPQSSTYATLARMETAGLLSRHVPTLPDARRRGTRLECVWRVRSNTAPVRAVSLN